MRHMYDSDGNIPYAGAVRASRRWKSSQTRSGRIRTNDRPKATMKAAEVELDNRTHKERIAAILASSKWSNHDYNNG